jgi:predicted RNase H-like nuclease (RuvC/YqgF family)
MLVFYSGYGQWCEKFSSDREIPKSVLHSKSTQCMEDGFIRHSYIELVTGIFKLPDRAVKEVLYSGKTTVEALLACRENTDCINFDTPDNKEEIFFLLYGDNDSKTKTIEKSKTFYKDEIENLQLELSLSKEIEELKKENNLLVNQNNELTKKVKAISSKLSEKSELKHLKVIHALTHALAIKRPSLLINSSKSDDPLKSENISGSAVQTQVISGYFHNLSEPYRIINKALKIPFSPPEQ